MTLRLLFPKNYGDYAIGYKSANKSYSLYICKGKLAARERSRNVDPRRSNGTFFLSFSFFFLRMSWKRSYWPFHSALSGNFALSALLDEQRCRGLRPRRFIYPRVIKTTRRVWVKWKYQTSWHWIYNRTDNECAQLKLGSYF